MDESNSEKLTKLLEESANAVVGLGVLGFQKAQVIRRQLEKDTGPLKDHVKELLSNAEAQLPEAAKQAVHDIGKGARELAEFSEKKLREILGKL